MNDWFNELQQQFQQVIDQAASELEQQCDEAVDQVDLWLTETFEGIDEAVNTATSDLIDQAEPLISPEVRQAFDEWVDEFGVWLDECDQALETSLNALIEVLLDEGDISSGNHEHDAESRDRSPFNSPFDPPDPENDPNWFVPLSHVRPTAKQYPACRGCQHYHGYRYGENLLVCAMHPYGWEDEQCPDWEGDRR